MDLDPRLHFVVATAIIVKDPRDAARGRGRYLIAKWSTISSAPVKGSPVTRGAGDVVV